MAIKQLRKLSVTIPYQVGLKSPPEYLELTYRANPTWGCVMDKAQHITATEACCLWAGAVAVGNGCRISEVLRIRAGAVQPNGMAYTQGSKGSRGRLLYLGLTPAQALEFQNAPAKMALFQVEYIQVWRTCVKYGLAERIAGHKHLAVTHAGRYTLAQKVAGQAGEELAGEILGHKSANTIQYYIDPQGCKKIVSKKQAISKEQKLYNLVDLLTELHSTKGKQNEKTNHV